MVETEIWENRVIAPDIGIANYMKEGNCRSFHLIAAPVKQPLLKELTIDGLGYNESTPGPLIVMKQGEWIALTVENRLDEPTTVHVHGLAKPNSQDGAPDIEPATPFIMPGESYTYRFQCWQSGTFFYHAGNPSQIGRGLVGPFIVLPVKLEKNQSIPCADYVLFLQSWQVPQPMTGKVYPGTYKPDNFDVTPNFFTINGKAFPDTSPLYVKCGEQYRIRFINKSSHSHTMHLHGHDFLVVEEDGFPRRMMDDTLNVASAKRFSVEFLAKNPGVLPMNGTKTFHQTNNGESPGGMITRVIYCPN